ncbi:MAG TPA: hypothetical protein VFI31_22770, partial [Pirellulales bacterium]|nr:hypothetical protein [Pirellulales bacterium]
MLLVAVAAAVGVPLFYQRFDDEVRRRVEEKLAAHYPDLSVSVRAARFLMGKGIEIRGVSVVEPNVAGPAAELAYIEELLLEGDTQWQELLRGELRISRVVFRRPTIRVAQRPDGSWSAAKLLPLPRLSKDPPAGVIENGVVELLDPLKPQGGSLIARDAQLTFEAAPTEQSSQVRFKSSSAAPTPLRVRGHFVADHVQRVDIDATLEPSGKEWSLAGSLDGLDFSPEFVRALPAVLSRRIAELSSVRCSVQGRFQLTQSAAAQGEIAFDASGRISRGRVDDPRLPYPLTDLRAAFVLNNRELAITDLTARNGQTTLAVELHRQGYAKQCPYTLVVKSRRMVFDQQLRSILPLEWQNEWHKYLPAGEFDADLKLAYDGQGWRPELIVACKSVSFSFIKFPYRLERGQGRIELVDDLLKVDLKAFTEGEEVRIFGDFRHPGPKATGKVNIRGDN